MTMTHLGLLLSQQITQETSGIFKLFSILLLVLLLIAVKTSGTILVQTRMNFVSYFQMFLFVTNPRKKKI